VLLSVQIFKVETFFIFLVAFNLFIFKSPTSNGMNYGEDERFKFSLAFRNLDEISDEVLPNDKESIRVLDLTENNLNGLNDLKFLRDFPQLKTLILDKNQIQSNMRMPIQMPNLTTLWLNHNRIENLSIFIEQLSESCPNLVYLSMINNKAAPSYFNGGTLSEYNDFRVYVMSKLVHLKMLDDREISEEERAQSAAIYGRNRRLSKPSALFNKNKTRHSNNNKKNKQSKLFQKADKKFDNVNNLAEPSHSSLIETERRQNEENMILNQLPDLNIVEKDEENNEYEIDTRDLPELEINDLTVTKPPSPHISILVDLDNLPDI
jgi:hypothetical protein